MSNAIAFMSIKTQFENLGDALINRELATLISDRVPLCLDLTRSPASFHATMNVRLLNNTTLLTSSRGQLLSDMTRCALSGQDCYFFLNPGGLGGGVGDHPRAFASSLVYNLILLLLNRVGVRICMVGVSFETMTLRERLVAKFRRNICHSFAVRDKASARYLTTLGICPDDVVPDLSFNLYRQQPPDSFSRDFATAMSFRTDRGAGLEVVLEFATRVVERHAPGSRHAIVSQVSRDERGMQLLHQKLAQRFGSDRIVYFDIHDNISAASALYSRVSGLYSNRLHALLLGSHAGATPLALGAHTVENKISALFDDLGLSDHLFDFRETIVRLPQPLDPQVASNELRRLNNYFDRLLGTHASPNAAA